MKSMNAIFDYNWFIINQKEGKHDYCKGCMFKGNCSNQCQETEREEEEKCFKN